jgi:hypothetical protein
LHGNYKIETPLIYLDQIDKAFFCVKSVANPVGSCLESGKNLVCGDGDRGRFFPQNDIGPEQTHEYAEQKILPRKRE